MQAPITAAATQYTGDRSELPADTRETLPTSHRLSLPRKETHSGRGQLPLVDAANALDAGTQYKGRCLYSVVMVFNGRDSLQTGVMPVIDGWAWLLGLDTLYLATLLESVWSAWKIRSASRLKPLG